MATMKKYPRDLSEFEVDPMVESFDRAVDDGRVRPVDGEVSSKLKAAAVARSAGEERVEPAVLAAKQAGLSWGIVGAQLGVNRQGARRRYERLVDS
jgi:hypothetical protein